MASKKNKEKRIEIDQEVLDKHSEAMDRQFDAFMDFISGKRDTFELDKGHNQPIYVEKKKPG